MILTYVIEHAKFGIFKMQTQRVKLA